MAIRALLIFALLAWQGEDCRGYKLYEGFSRGFPFYTGDLSGMKYLMAYNFDELPNNHTRLMMDACMAGRPYCSFHKAAPNTICEQVRVEGFEDTDNYLHHVKLSCLLGEESGYCFRVNMVGYIRNIQYMSYDLLGTC